MDRNSLIGTILIALITVFFLINTNQKRQQEALEQQRIEEQRIADSIMLASEQTENVPTGQDQGGAEAAAPSIATGMDTVGMSDQQRDSLVASIRETEANDARGKYGPFHANANGEETQTIVENDLIKVAFSNKGGRIESVELKQFKTHDGKPLNLLQEDRFESSFLLPLVGLKSVRTADLYFDRLGEGFTVSGEDKKSIAFRLKVNEGQYFEQKYTLSGNSYLIDYQVNLVRLNDVIASNTTKLDYRWSNRLAPFEQNLENERRYSNLYYRLRGDDVEHLNANKPNEAIESSSIEWVSFKQQFFNSTLIYQEGFKGSILNLDVDTEDSVNVKMYSADVDLPYRSKELVSYDFQYFMGPNDYRTLKRMKMDLEDVIQFAPDFFLFSWMGAISKWLIIPLFKFLEQHIASYGIIILIMTLLIKMALFPLTFKSYKSAAAMRVLKPELDALKEKYKDDQQKLGTEQMKLYSSAGVNPLGGCLPMLFQMPILLAMYYFFPASIELRQEAFLWATDLSTFDNVLNLPFEIPVYGSHVSLFTLLMTVSSILYATTQPQMAGGGPGGAQMKYMPYIFPVFLLFIFNKWPAALTYYYFLSNIITFGQSWAAKKFFIDEDKLYQKMQENKKKPKKASKWQKRLEEIQKQQQQARKNQGRSQTKKKRTR